MHISNSYNKAKAYFTILFLIQCFISMGHEIKGKIMDPYNKPVEGVGIYNETTKDFTYSDISGYFEFDSVAVNDVLYFYSLGYETVSKIISNEDLDASVSVVLKEAPVSLEQVVLISKIDAFSRMVQIDVEQNPVRSSQEVLRRVPGLLIGQHAGGGKAEQLFLRGFDLDHGTDIAISVDDMPVNLVSHAHGQGYSDLHFLIPETLDRLDFEKGPYRAEQGNFATAGHVAIKTKDKIEQNQITLEAGDFNTLRLVGLIKLLETDHADGYIASEGLVTDGFFESPQNFNRLNLMGSFSFSKENESLRLGASHFQSRWDASGQIPQRAVDAGLISRFGSIDDTEGGTTSRSNLWLNHFRVLDEHQSLRTSAYLSAYDFELYSNFTFFLNDPVNGDQIRQKEDRIIMGAKSVYQRKLHTKDEVHAELEIGSGFRYDQVSDVELSRSRNRRETLENVALGQIDELNGFAFADLEYTLGKWTLNGALRTDYFNFQYENDLSETYDRQRKTKVFVAPKFNVLYTASPKFQAFFKTGLGFHSNDARVVLANTGERTLPGAFGSDLGIIWKPSSRTVINAGLWMLRSQQEFVYVGDEGIVEPSGRSNRAGVDLGFRHQWTDDFYLYADVNYTYARSIDEPEGQDFIPLAPDLTSAGGMTFGGIKNLKASLQYRYIKDRPANEDNSIVAEGYFVTDLNLNYSINNITLGVVVENLFDTEWNETQFATESRLRNEQQAVEEIHFTPGTPFFIRGRLSFTF